jgi:RHS repeat-associated protein
MPVNLSPRPTVSYPLAAFILAITFPLVVYAQNVQYQKGTVDHGFRSDLKIDPSTLALNFQLPLKVYRGRAGLDLPITLYYSSKVWTFEYGGYYQEGPCCEPSFTANPQGLPTENNYSWINAYYGHDGAGNGSNAGWTGSLDFPHVVAGLTEKYNFDGNPCQECSINQTFFVKRLRIRLPDGSTHELRRSDAIYTTDNANDIGTYYSTDGSRLRYVQENNGAATLHLPDGSRYLMGPKKYIDRNGNTLSFNNNGTATDTLGRTAGLQYVSGTSPGDVIYSLAGVNGTPAYYTFRYRNLGAAGVLTTPQSLRYLGDMMPIGGAVSSPSLFESGGGSRTTNGELFNPVVLHEILLPNGTKYTFTFNLYGEIEKIIYPTGGYEKFRYDRIEALDPLNEPYAQANRGVVERWVSPDGSETNLHHWTYSVVSVTPYVIRTTAPDGSYSERVLQKGRGPGIIKYGFDDPRAGMPLEERTYSAAGQMLRRSLMAYDVTGPLPGGHASAARDARLTKQVDILLDTGGDSLTSTTTYSYDADQNLISTSQHDYVAVSSSVAQSGAIGVMPQGPALRTSETTFLINDPNIDAATRDAYRVRGFLSLPTSTRVRNGSITGPVVAQSSISYDEGGLFAQLNDYSVVSGWSDPQTPYRGNPTTTRQWVNFDGATISPFPSGTYLTAHAQYDQCGNVRKTWDARDTTLTNPSQISYQDAFSDAVFRNSYAFPTSMATAVPDPNGTYGSSVAFTSTSVYDFNTGKVVSTTDANAKTTSYDYTDPLDRLKQVTLPDTGRVRYNYSDAAGDLYVQTLSDQEFSRSIETRNYFDGLGRPARSFLFEGTTSTPWLVTDTYYDNMGRVLKASNPYRVTSASSAVPANCSACTSTSYDSLGRVLAVTTSDGAQVVTAYGAATSGTLGTVTTVTDQALRKRRTLTDALGRLVRVDEPNKNTGNLDVDGTSTSYAYDVLGNLLRVDQGAQQRFFMYDSLGRLLRAKNPEQGSFTPDLSGGFPALTDASSGASNSDWSMGYVYDANGNLSKRKDARNVVTSYEYDKLNRNTTVDYSDTASINPDLTRTYDSAGNGKGRLRESYAGGSENVGVTVEHTRIQDYDAMGRPKELRQRFKTDSVWFETDSVLGDPTRTYQTHRTYDLAGHVKTQTYPSGRIVTYNYDQAGRLGDKDAQNLAFTGNLGGTYRNYSTGILYSPMGGMTKEEFGTDTKLYNKSFYNSRGQLAEIRVSTSYTGSTDTTWNRGAIINHYSNGYGCWGATCNAPDNNGNLKKQDVYIPANDQLQNAPYTMWYQQYDYDSLNRLQRVHEYTGNTTTDWQQEYVYDRYGNRTVEQNVTKTWGAGINKKEFTVNTANNRLGVPGGQSGTMTYDNAGNLALDTYSGAASNRAYDAENRMTSEIQGGSVVAGAYTYNADGQRVRRKAGATETWQVYGFDGELVAEYAANASPSTPQKEYGYRNGQLLITAEPSQAIGSIPNASSFVSQSVPETMLAGHQYAASVTFKNTGSNTWTSAAHYNLGSSNDNGSWAVYRAALPASVAPNGEVTFNFTITAPATPGAYSFRWRMVQDYVEWFGAESANVNIVISGAGTNGANAAQCVWQSAPQVMTAGQSYPVSVRMRNTGANTWTSAAHYNLGSFADNGAWGIYRIGLPASTPPNAEATFNFTVTAPSTPGTYSFEWRMVQDYVEWFGDNSTKVQVVVAAQSVSASGFQWLVSDQLGTPRMIFDQTGSLAATKRHDYLPFGEELVAGQGARTNALGHGAADGVRQKFSDKERDVETGLDYFGARYFASAQGRFTSVDPMPVTVENFVNPQRFNQYSYVLNNPLASVDPDGSDGQGGGGDKVISVFLSITAQNRDSWIYSDPSRTVYEKGPGWPSVNDDLRNGYSLETFGYSDVTGNKGLPQFINESTFGRALNSSDVVVFVGHGDGPTASASGQPIIFVPTNGIRVGDTMYNSGGTVNLTDGSRGPRPGTNALVVLNFSCNSAQNSDFFDLTGQGPQYVIGIDSGTSGMGTTGAGTAEKAAAAFVRTYANTRGTLEKRVQAGIKAAQKVIDKSGDPVSQGDKVVIVKSKPG